MLDKKENVAERPRELQKGARCILLLYPSTCMTPNQHTSETTCGTKMFTWQLGDAAIKSVHRQRLSRENGPDDQERSDKERE